MKKKVLVAMSGGVDSSVAAARVVAAGHEAVGVHMALSPDPDQGRTGSRGCCTVEDAFDARRVADKLGMPFYVWDMAAEFKTQVMDDFINEYAAGRTPNPCVRCNERIKFAELMDRAVALGFDAVATGHYAQVLAGSGGVELHRAADIKKDQSYVLAVMGSEALGRSMFPLGDVTSKDVVRAEAEALGFSVASKPDSHDICFIPDGDTRGFLDRHIPRDEGAIVDVEGNEVGRHDGAIGYTVGQRRGLKLGRPAPDGKPRYVLDVSVVNNTVTVGSQNQLNVVGIRADSAVWLADVPSVDEVLQAQVRAHGKPFDVRVSVNGNALTVSPLNDQEAVAAGQTLVIYRGSRALVASIVTGCDRA